LRLVFNKKDAVVLCFFDSIYRVTSSFKPINTYLTPDIRHTGCTMQFSVYLISHIFTRYLFI